MDRGHLQNSTLACPNNSNFEWFGHAKLLFRSWLLRVVFHILEWLYFGHAKQEEIIGSFCVGFGCGSVEICKPILVVDVVRIGEKLSSV